ncbi:hypothetical protein BpHYR1_029621 [Brachionus plicatilis]|uniref:RING-type domain-containing protein n=1 Tax=Brachionus plicatilis TaxID=10195 RepID=A0A3M7RBZ7_BRAPC|nr:hypothetical protein BpHYR1_029621 [Brachionus plicatilis]
MNRMNHIWPNNIQNMFNLQQAQLMLLQQQIQQQMSQSEKHEPAKFSSSFSVNNLIGQQMSRPAPHSTLALAWSQQLAASMVNNYRHQMSKCHRPAFGEPKKQKTHDMDHGDFGQFNTSNSSVSSPSSSSSALLESSMLNQQQSALNESDVAHNFSERNTPDLLSYSSSSSSSCSFSLKRTSKCFYVLGSIRQIIWKYEQIKEKRVRRSMRKSIQRLKYSKENVATCTSNQKAISKREFDETDCELSTGTMARKRFRREINLDNCEQENEEYINVVDNDDEQNDLVQDQDKVCDDEDSVENNLSKCLGCLQVFSNDALISVACWHVNCHQCWLKAISENKNYNFSKFFLVN